MKESDIKIIKILTERFSLPFEQAKMLYFAYPITGSCEEGVEAAANVFDIDPETVRKVFYSLDDLYEMVEEEKRDLRRWWETGEM